MLLENTVKYFDKPSRGKVITVSSSRGGSGVTSVSTLLASLIATTATSEIGFPLSVVVVDMNGKEPQLDQIYGTSAFNTERLLAESAKSYWEMTDQMVLDHIVYSPTHKSCALLSSKNNSAFEGLGDDGWQSIIEILVNRFDIIIIDYGSDFTPSPLLMKIAMASDAVMLVSEHNSYGLREIQGIIEEIRSGNNYCFYAEDLPKFSIVLNRLGQDSVTPTKISEIPVIGTIRDLGIERHQNVLMDSWSSDSVTEAFKNDYVLMTKKMEKLLHMEFAI